MAMNEGGNFTRGIDTTRVDRIRYVDTPDHRLYRLKATVNKLRTLKYRIRTMLNLKERNGIFFKRDPWA
jgi:hypothetical protein